jgi:hypothetical protein
MKKITIISMFAVTILSFVACNSNQTSDQGLKYDSHRTKIISTIVKDSTYSKEMMDMMMSDDNCKNMMSQHMMENSEMINKNMDNMMAMCKNDSSMCKMMMSKTMDMCESDTSMRKMMTNCMKSHKDVMESVKGYCDMDTKAHHRGDNMGHNKK